MPFYLLCLLYGSGNARRKTKCITSSQDFWLDLEEALYVSALPFPENKCVILQGEIVTDIGTRIKLKIHWGNQMRLRGTSGQLQEEL